MRFNILIFLLVCLCCVFGNANGRGTFLDAIETGIDEVRGFIESLFNDIPTPDEIVNVIKQLTLGLPQDIVLVIANILCNGALSEDTIHSKYVPEINEIQFQLRTACNRYNYPVLEAAKLIGNPEFDVKKKVVIAVSGWTTFTNTTELLVPISQAYNCRTDYNFLVLDNDMFLDKLYSWSAVNTEIIGEYMAMGLNILTKIVPLENIHLVGHSLGAQVVGNTGYHFTKLTGKLLPRITGLDPARPCFDEGHGLHGVFRGNAEFVDIIHTTPGVVGQWGPLGDVDFYVAGFATLKPGCLDISCSHDNAWQYYAESVYPNNEYNFLATRCTSLAALNHNQCQGTPIPMGFATPPSIKGSYFVNVNAQQPYGQNANEDFQSFSDECGQCTEEEK